MSQDQAEQEHPHRYDAVLAEAIELKWQDYWDAAGTWHAPNPAGPLAGDTGGREKLYVLDMFPYPSNAGLHVGHPLGYIGTDVWARFQRMQGRNVLHTLGYDAFGLPAEQFAVQTGQHPRVTTEAAIANYTRQLRRLGLAHDPRRAVATTDVAFYRWTQWIFLQIFDSWYDPETRRARPIEELRAQYESGERPGPWAELSGTERREVVDGHRLAYRAEATVNWCPGLGTVLANEEVTPDGRSERGNFPVFRRPLTQWMMRITAYADRLIDDLDTIEWPDKVKRMQRNWIGRSEGARAVFTAGDERIEVFTTRPDTLFGATYVVLAPEHPLVDRLVTDGQREAVEAYRRRASQLSELDRQVDTREKTGVYLGVDAVNPVNGEAVPVWVADYVLLGYGTGAIMAVPAHDTRDHEFATTFGLPIRQVVETPPGWPADEVYTGEGTAIDSGFLDGLDTATAKKRIGAWLEEQGKGRPAITYKLHDWLFSRQRYWGEPFPIVYDETGLPIALPESMLPVELPDVDDYAPRIAADDDTAAPEPPLGRAEDWATVTLDLGDGPKTYRRELNTMPQWAGSCWYYLRYLDPTNEERFVDPEVERYWMNVDLYVGGVEHAVLHLLYARFWHKVLYDLGHLSSAEPFQRLFNQGYVLAPAYTDERGMYVDAASVTENDEGTYAYEGASVTRHTGKMGKSLKNSVSPDDVYRDYGADTMRLYEMATGPLDTDRPWSTTDIVGVHRLLQRIWRAVVDEETGAPRVTDEEPDPEILRETHRAVAKVTEEMAAMRFNTAIARITELANAVTKAGVCTRQTAETLTLLVAPLAPHVAEELWSRLGHEPSVGWQPFPVADPALLAEADVTLVVQVNGKVRDRLTVPADAGEAAVEAAALASEKVQAALGGKPVRKVIARPPALVNLVI